MYFSIFISYVIFNENPGKIQITKQTHKKKHAYIIVGNIQLSYLLEYAANS